MDGMGDTPDPEADGSRRKHTQAHEDKHDNQDDFDHAGAGLGRRGRWLGSHDNGGIGCGWGNWDRGSHRCATSQAGLVVGRYFSSTLCADASHCNLLIDGFWIGKTESIPSNVNIPQYGVANSVFFVQFRREAPQR
jgi:hypothetical protein